METETAADPDMDFAPYFTAAWSMGESNRQRLTAAQKLRFDVYCVDCGFLDAADHPGGLESDIYDDTSLHFYADNRSGELVGYVRLVHATATGRFPWQLHCGDLLPGVTLPNQGSSAEISRLMVRRDYRRRRGDLLSGVDTSDRDDPAAEERRSRTPQILLSLYRQMYHRSLDNGIRYWYAAMERPLARTLQTMGFGFAQIGPERDYFGPVAPYLADLRDLEERLSARCPELLAWMKAGHSA